MLFIPGGGNVPGQRRGSLHYFAFLRGSAHHPVFIAALVSGLFSV